MNKIDVLTCWPSICIVDDNTYISKNITHIKVELQGDQQKLLLFNVATSNIVNSEETHKLNFAPHVCSGCLCSPEQVERWQTSSPMPKFKGNGRKCVI